LDDTGRITDHGRQIAALPLHPRLAHMLAVAGPQAAPLAALLAERDPLRGAGADLTLRLSAIDRPGPDADRATIDRIRAEAARLARAIPVLPVNSNLSAAECAALSYPDRIGLRRPGDAPRYVLSGGKGAVIDPADPLSRAGMVVATDLDGDPREARLRVGIGISDASVRRLFADRIGRRDIVEWSRREGRVVARSEERLGALVLSEAPLAKPDPDAVARAAFDGLRAIALPLTDAARRFRARIALLARDGADMPDLSDAALLADPDWLLPWLGGRRTEADLRAMDLTAALKSLLSWDQGQLADRLAPAHFTTPLGRQIPIDYEGDHPSVTLRLQEMFGVTVHPTVGPKALPLRVTLLSPAQRPVQVTTDLPGFWRTSYADVRRDMRGSYPRHPWPEDPTQAEPTLRAKPRGT
jgi:ATP-dependent helicase HrpB